jgi:phosphohistidine phosphatase
MELFLLRHAIAEDPKPARPDSERALTSDGRRKLRAVLRCAAQAGLAPSLIITSPFVRAVETAELAAEKLGYEGDIVKSRALQPESSPASAWQEIRPHAREAQVLAVGHEPLFSSWTAYLLNAPSLRVDFKKAAIVLVEFERVTAVPHGTLRWMLTHKLATER